MWRWWGDVDRCIAAAKTIARERGIPQLTVMFPYDNQVLEEKLASLGFETAPATLSPWGCTARSHQNAFATSCKGVFLYVWYFPVQDSTWIFTTAVPAAAWEGWVPPQAPGRIWL